MTTLISAALIEEHCPIEGVARAELARELFRSTLRDVESRDVGRDRLFSALARDLPEWTEVFG